MAALMQLHGLTEMGTEIGEIISTNLLGQKNPIGRQDSPQFPGIEATMPVQNQVEAGITERQFVDPA